MLVLTLHGCLGLLIAHDMDWTYTAAKPVIGRDLSRAVIDPHHLLDALAGQVANNPEAIDLWAQL